MRKRAWKSKLKKACMELGTYKPQFDYSIDALAGILELRDKAWEEYEASGEGVIVEFTNKNGSTNKVKNPNITLVDDMTKAALPIMKELGLTPAGLKKINEEVFIKAKEEKNSNNLMDLMKSRQQMKE